MTDPCKGKATLEDCYMSLWSPDAPCTSPRNIMAAQVALKDAGHYKGDINGVWGKDSSYALMASKKSFVELVPGCTGPVPLNVSTDPIDPDDPCKDRSLTDCFFDLYQPSGPCASRGNIMAAQVALKGFGYYKGNIDGIWGKDSSNALRASGKGYHDLLLNNCEPPFPVYIPPRTSPPTPEPGSPTPTDPGGYEKIVYRDETEGLTSVVLTVVAFAAGVGLGLAFKR